MGIVQLPVKPVGQEGILPATKFMVTTDLASTIQAPGYLNSSNLEGTSVSQGDIIEILYNYNVAANSGITGFFFVSYVSNLIKLNKVSSNTVWTDLTITAAELATAGKVIVQYAVPGQLMSSLPSPSMSKMPKRTTWSTRPFCQAMLYSRSPFMIGLRISSS